MNLAMPSTKQLNLPAEVSVADLVDRAVTIGDRFATTAFLIDQEGSFPNDEFGQLHEAGLLAYPLRKAQEGQLLDALDGATAWPGVTSSLLRILEEVGRGNLAVGRLYEGHVNALLLIQQFGRPDQRARWAEDVRAGKIFGVWNTQAADGVKFGPVGDDGSVVLGGVKTFASGAGHIARPIVTGANPDGGWQMAVIPTDEVDAAVDRSSWRPLGMYASASYRIDLGGVRISSERCLLGRPGDYFREPWFSGGAIRFAAVQLGGIRALLDATVDTLRRFDRADDPYQRARVGTMAIAVESGRQWLRAAGAAADRVGEDPTPEVISATITHAQMTRTAVEAIGQDVLRLAEQCVGARGLLRPHPVERIGRDLTIYLRQPGPDSALAQIGQARLEGRPGPDGWF